MTKTLDQINAQIAELQQKAEAIKAREVAGVIERIKEAIAHYGLTAADLGFTGRAIKPAKTAEKVASPKARKKVARKSAGVVKFRDDAGNSWTGHGKRPKWFLAALEAGKKPEDLKV